MHGETLKEEECVCIPMCLSTLQLYLCHTTYSIKSLHS